MPLMASAPSGLMLAQNKSSFALQFLFGLVLLWTILLVRFTHAQRCDELTTLKIPALGREATLGELYDERNGNFREGVNIFRDVVPKETVVTSKRDRKYTDFRIIRHDHQHTDKFHLLNVDENSAVNILAGVLEVEGGASRFLKETNNASEVNGALIFRQQTLTETLQIYFDAIKTFYNRALLNHNSATHIVTGILWGGQAVVSVAAPISQDQSRREAENRIRSEFKESLHSQSFTNASFYSIKVYEDVELSAVVNGRIINNLSEALFTTADGRGMQLEYTLTPLCTIREFLKEPSLREVTVETLDHWTLQEIVEIFDQLFLIRQKLVDLENNLELHSDCFSNETRTGFQSLQNGFTNSLEKFKDSLKDAIVKARSGKMAHTNLGVNLDEYTEGKFGGKNVELLMLAEFSGALTKIDFYTYVQSEFENVKYIGASGNLNIGAPSVSNRTHTDTFPKGSDPSTRMYLLYYKHASTVEKVDAWLESSQVFFGNLQKDASSASWDFYVIDCDFGHLHCGNISQPTIHEYSNGKLTSCNYVVTTEESQTLGQMLLQCTEDKRKFEALFNLTHTCLNGGAFLGGHGDDRFQCICKTGYTGNKCETLIDSCESNPCNNNGWCRTKVNSYTCKCQIGFTENCAEPVDWCALEEAPCKHGGTCQNKQLGFTCTCAAPWIGQLCENKIDPCILHACLNGATCAAAPNLLDYLCHCKDGYKGPFCECTSLPAEVLETQPELKTTSLDCGGIISIPSNERYHVFTFEPSKIDSTNNRCRWTFNSEHGGRLYSIKAKVTLLCSRLSVTRSQLSLHYYMPPDVEDDSLFTSKLTNSAKEVDLTYKASAGLFLSFITHATYDPVKFTILKDAVQTSLGASGARRSFNDGSGSQTFYSFSYLTLFSVAVNPAKARTTLSLDLFQTDKTDACVYDDNLDVYEISGKDEPKRLERFCNPVISPVSFTSEFPLLTLFYVYSDHTTKRQFTISWK